MSTLIACAVQWIVFPILLTSSLISRPAIISIPYLIYLFCAPFVSNGSKRTCRRRADGFYWCILMTSAVIILIEIALLILSYAKGVYSLKSLGAWGQFLENIGVTELYEKDSQPFCWSFLMDSMLCASSLVTLFILNKSSDSVIDIEESISTEDVFDRNKSFKVYYKSFVKGLAICFVMSTILIAATLQPSVPSAIYFVAFLVVITTWALNRHAYDATVLICRVLCLCLIVHISAIFACQANWLQEYVDTNNRILRYFGLKTIFQTKAVTPEHIVTPIYTSQTYVFLSPAALLLCYYTLVIFLRDFDSKKQATNGAVVSLESIKGNQNSNRFGDSKKTFMGRAYRVMCRHSNIVSNLMMMIWSIVFRSWLSIVFLLVVSVLWIRPIEQKSAHRINLFIVFYADCLLLLQYFYYVILTADELPYMDSLFANIAHIGLVTFESFPCAPLLFKAFCTITFCFTLRQEYLKQSNNRASFRSTTSHLSHVSSDEKATIWKCFHFGISVLTHLWVLMILLTIFIYAIYGNEVNTLKLCYMIFFLVFLVSYQLSLVFWSRISYFLWMLVIVVSMCNLILIYTYQFKGIDQLWEDYLGINKYMQYMIGLRRFETEHLLIELFYFTFVVVITAIQLSIFHKRYTAQFMLKPTKKRTISDNAGRTSNTNECSTPKKTFVEKVVEGIGSFIDVNMKIFDWFCSFMELQFFHVVLVLGFYTSISEVSAFNLVINILVVIACLIEDTFRSLSCGIISFVAGVTIISKLIYQLVKIPELLFEFLCFTDDETPMSFSSMAACNVNNTSEWLGVFKSNNDQNLLQFLANYIILIAAATIFSSVSYYQSRKRFLRGESNEGPRVLFSNVTWEDADKNVTSLIKYLFNHGFYQFGIEVTLIVLVVLITVRNDIVSIAYVVWLALICSVRRKQKKLIWPIFQYFITLATIGQYAVILSLPSILHSNFQWELQNIQRIEIFIALKNEPHKLLLDFLLLMCVCRQQKVFGIENKYKGKRYAGGQNSSSVQYVGVVISKQLPIETHDFLYPTSWLDILKCIVYYSSFWVTLSVVLLTGTNNVSAFSLGYLMSSFMFCYIGTNFYMKPIDRIVRWWSLLIAFNIFVIATKCILNLRLVVDETFLSHDVVTSVHRFLSKDKQATMPLEMSYDALCFTFLIFQLRIFKSIDFCHIINESKATFVCDSRGTKLLSDRMREMHNIQLERERENLEKIKRKVAKIKANQRRFEPNLISAKDHYEAVRYNGKYLYEEFVERTDFHLRHNDSSIETEESFLLKNQSRLEGSFFLRDFNASHRNNSWMQNDSKIESNENCLWSVARDFLISLTLHLYKCSRNYRYVHEILTKEKKMLKLKACEPRFTNNEEDNEEKSYFFANQHSVVVEFLQALWFALIANTNVICYLLIFLNTILTMSILALPMSLFVCLWATLTIPRPSKKFWLTIIAYTQFLVFVQYFLEIISHFHKIEMSKSSAKYNLILLHFVLFHRSVLKHMGIWTFDKKANNEAIHAFYFLNVRSLRSVLQCSSIIQIAADVYTFMFLCDLINFFVLMFGFSAFSQSSCDGGVQNYLNEDQIPFRFLLTLMVQFISLIIDRAIYLRRNMKGKIIFYVISVVAVHIWLFHFLLLFHEKPSHPITWPPMLFYFIKCIYFLLSAYQIRCGYPKRVSDNFANNGFSVVHWRVSEVYQMIPFLSEARMLLDWICIKTSLTLYEWFKMEDIYSQMFVVKCHREYEKTVPRARGVVRGSKGDYLRAFLSLLVFFVLIWGPWALFTFDHTVGKSNIPYEVSVALHVGSNEPLYRMTAQASQIHQFTETDFQNLRSVFANNTKVQTFITNYDEDDIAAISLDVNSNSLWTISPPSLHKLKNDLIENVAIKFRFSVSISRQTHEQPSDTIESNQAFYLHANDPAREELLQILQHGNRDQQIHLPFLFPKFLKVMNSKGLQPIPQFVSENDVGHQNITLSLLEMNQMHWWRSAEDCNSTLYEDVLSKLPYADCSQRNVLYTFNDKLFPSSLSPFIRGGIVGLYSTYILLTSKFFREFLASNIANIIREDLPYVDRILSLCSDICLVREQGDFKLEEDLYAKLIFLYRSPETMIRWTRQPNEETSATPTGDIDESDAEKALRKSLSHNLF